MTRADPIGIAGTGAMARALAGALLAGGAPVAAIASRSIERAEAAARSLGAGVRPVTLTGLPPISSHIIVATADARIPEVAAGLAAAGLSHGVTLHTCGGCAPDVLAPLRSAGAACGVFHPLQTVTPAADPATLFRGVTIALSGDVAAVAWGGELARCLDATGILVDPDRLSSYHAGAVLASNAVAALVDAAILLMGRAGIESDTARRAIEPLTRAAVDNVFRLGPEAALTGPVVRGDIPTINRHLQALADVNPEIGALYHAVSRALVALAARSRLDASTAAALSAALEAQNPLKQ